MKVQSASYPDIAKWLPSRVNGRDINKGAYGHVFVIAGSRGFAGAPVMVAEAAARAGAGLVTLAVPEEILQAVEARVSPVVITHGLPMGSHSAELALILTAGASVIALGPGLGQNEDTAYFLRQFISRCLLPLVIDADALNLLAKEPDRGRSILNNRKDITILTPHPGEMGRLLDLDTQLVQEDRQGAILRAVQNYRCFVLLKGFQTLIAGPDETLYRNNRGNAGMATGGTGDVLTGVIAAFLAQKLSPLHAAVGGAFIHGLAADLAEREMGGTTGMIATDLIAQLPHAIAHCQKGAT